ncbi:MAG: glycosyltransferase [Muribaculaceae bacterium]|nr:glycosyltransferase [Muribaculaceae bacterium]
MTAPLITASIVIHRTEPGMLRRAIDSLRGSAVSHLYLIDNSPSPISAPPESTADLCVSYAHVKNDGFGAAHNIAIRRAISEGSDFHLVMNPDVEWEGDAIGPMVEYMRQHPDTGMAMPRTVYPDGVLQYTCRMLPTPWDVFAKRFLPARFTETRMRRYLLEEADHSQIIDCPYLLGSCLLFRIKALEDTGLFDERFFMYPEDIDITRRIHRKYRSLYLPLTTVTHRHAAASRKSLRMLRIHILNMIKYFNKWGWFIDKERREFNRRMLNEIPKYSAGEEIPPGRG